MSASFTHTQLPWDARVASIGSAVWDVGARGVLVAQVLSPKPAAAARFIALACNSYDALYEALLVAARAAHAWGSGSSHGEEENQAECQDPVCVQARAALEMAR